MNPLFFWWNRLKNEERTFDLSNRRPEKYNE